MNNVSLSKMVLLTAPNMSGKSTLMRSICAATLLASSGLFVPAAKASIPSAIDGFFLRMVGGDSPSDHQSAFAVEVDGVRSVLDQATENSLVLIDEFGRGTSSKDGVALAGAVIEELEKKKSKCIFATHLHELQHVDLNSNADFWRMKTTVKDRDIRWTYQVEQGICTDSLALHCALRCGLQPEVVRRAFELQGGVGTTFDITDEKIGSGCSASDVFKQIVGEAVLVEEKMGLVPALASRPVVYVLEGSTWAYVGQSQNLQQRLTAHGRRFRDSPFKCYVTPVETQAIARELEASVIQSMLREGVVLISDHDGTSNLVKGC